MEAPSREAVEFLAAGTVLVGFAVDAVRRIAKSVTGEVKTTTAALGATIQALAGEVAGMREDYRDLRETVTEHGEDLAVLKIVPARSRATRARKGVTHGDPGRR